MDWIVEQSRSENGSELKGLQGPRLELQKTRPEVGLKGRWNEDGSYVSSVYLPQEWRVIVRRPDEQNVVVGDNENVLLQGNEQETKAFYDSQEMVAAYPGYRNVRMGRPSQGRSARIQAAFTPELEEWVQAQRQGQETFSDALFRLVSELRTKGQ